MEYKRDRRDGKFYMVEPTAGRTDYQEEIAVLNGVNIPLAAFADLTGISMEHVCYEAPCRGWRDSFGYRNAIAAGGDDPILELNPTIKIMDAYLRFDDPMPYIAARTGAMRERLVRLSGQNWKRFAR